MYLDVYEEPLSELEELDEDVDWTRPLDFTAAAPQEEERDER